MAYVITKDGKKSLISHEAGLKLWISLHNLDSLDIHSRARLERIAYIFLDYMRAPDDYVQENLQTIIPLALNDWVVDRHGLPIKPATEAAWAFARKWDLWAFGAPTFKVTKRSKWPAPDW